MQLQTAETLCLELMKLHGLTPEKGWSFQWLNSKNVAGKCRYLGTAINPKGGIIFLSRFVTTHHSDEQVRDTILHEIAHGLTPGHKHDRVWQRKAIEIGADGKRCYDVTDELLEAKKSISKYIGTCPKCGHEIPTSRLPKRDLWHKNCATKPYHQKDKIAYVANNIIKVAKPIQYATAACNPTPTTKAVGLYNQFPDSYKRMLDKFEKEFMCFMSNYIDKSTFENITANAYRSANSWRTLNREVRKACNQYVFDKKFMTHKQFQERFFYEGVMLGRTKHGATAPWL